MIYIRILQKFMQNSRCCCLEQIFPQIRYNTTMQLTDKNITITMSHQQIQLLHQLLVPLKHPKKLIYVSKILLLLLFFLIYPHKIQRTISEKKHQIITKEVRRELFFETSSVTSITKFILLHKQLTTFMKNKLYCSPHLKGGRGRCPPSSPQKKTQSPNILHPCQKFFDQPCFNCYAFDYTSIFVFLI
eukprot:TRINITY_DN14011_c0_g1_i1.p1 TRINITY_DN14011_c0_g1~~TRINITY_DN14011_c0_g1_i1.p1  ORF type:complete len:188 (+),score=-5.39 TRINITY_DN14011_c0_g1_i1:323-886(+)